MAKGGHPGTIFRNAIRQISQADRQRSPGDPRGKGISSPGVNGLALKERRGNPSVVPLHREPQEGSGSPGKLRKPQARGFRWLQKAPRRTQEVPEAFPSSCGKQTLTRTGILSPGEARAGSRGKTGKSFRRAASPGGDGGVTGRLRKAQEAPSRKHQMSSEGSQEAPGRFRKPRKGSGWQGSPYEASTWRRPLHRPCAGRDCRLSAAPIPTCLCHAVEH